MPHLRREREYQEMGEMYMYYQWSLEDMCGWKERTEQLRLTPEIMGPSPWHVQGRVWCKVSELAMTGHVNTHTHTHTSLLCRVCVVCL